MYEDYDFNQEDDFQMLVEGRCSDDEEFFKTEKSKSKNRQSTQKTNNSTNKSKRSPTHKSFNQRKHIPVDEDSDSRDSFLDIRDEYDKSDDRLDKYEKYNKYDDQDKFSDDDPVNPFDEAEEEVEKKPKNVSNAEDDGEEKIKRKNIVRNPRVMLNDDKLKSIEGVIKLPELFKQVKFKGKNHEKDDLNRIMSVYQSWSHRLMPSLQFNDFIEKTETLCRKAKMKVFLTKIRNGMPLDVRGEQPQSEEVINQFDESQDEELVKSPTLMPKTNMEDEFMDDDFMMNDEDNKILDEQLLGTQKKDDQISNEFESQEINESVKEAENSQQMNLDTIVSNSENNEEKEDENNEEKEDENNEEKEAENNEEKNDENNKERNDELYDKELGPDQILSQDVNHLKSDSQQEQSNNESIEKSEMIVEQNENDQKTEEPMNVLESEPEKIDEISNDASNGIDKSTNNMQDEKDECVETTLQ